MRKKNESKQEKERKPMKKNLKAALSVWLLPNDFTIFCA